MAAGANSFLGEVAIVAYNFAPNNWQLCQGQLLSISANVALFSLLGTSYGGNGSTTFGLPNLTEKVAIGVGDSFYGTYDIGQIGGLAANALVIANMPAHTHLSTNPLAMPTGSTSPDSNSPVNNYPSQTTSDLLFRGVANGSTNMAMQVSTITVGATGGGQSYANLQTFVGIYYIISLTGVYPPRS
jgi:microcystin-dependent protein